MPAATDAPASQRLRMQGVRKRFGATVALAGVDLCVNAGQVMALVGGMGRSINGSYAQFVEVLDDGAERVPPN